MQPLALFARNPTKPDGLDTFCRSCRKEYNQAYYQRTKDRHNPGRYARRKTEQQKIFNLFVNYMDDKSCLDCGETDVVVLEFDHQRDKIDDISNMIRQGRSWNTIINEIAKCEIVCANCHRRRTAKAFAWRKGR